MAQTTIPKANSQESICQTFGKTVQLARSKRYETRCPRQALNATEWTTIPKLKISKAGLRQLKLSGMADTMRQMRPFRKSRNRLALNGMGALHTVLQKKAENTFQKSRRQSLLKKFNGQLNLDARQALNGMESGIIHRRRNIMTEYGRRALRIGEKNTGLSLNAVKFN